MSVRTAAKKARLNVSTSRFAAAAIGGLTPGGRIVGITNGRFSLIDLLREILDQTGPARVTVCAWVASLDDAEAAAHFLSSGQAKRVTLVLGGAPKRRGPYLAKLARPPGCEVMYGQIHAKFVLVRNDQWNISVRTSMNLNRNQRLEQFDLDDDPQICDFFESVVDSIRSVGPAAKIDQALCGPDDLDLAKFFL